MRTGESQRADLRYQFRYKDARGNRRSIYSMDLKELRAKEEEVLSAAKAGVDYAAGQITVLELVERYTSLKNGVRYNTKVGYGFVMGILRKEDFGCRMINTIKISRGSLGSPPRGAGSRRLTERSFPAPIESPFTAQSE